MATLPTVGGSEGTWGTKLNAWLVVEHDATGGHDSAAFLDTLIGQLVYTCGGADVLGTVMDPGIVVDKATKTGPIPSGVSIMYVT